MPQLEQEKLNLDVSWRIGEEAFSYICEIIAAHGFKKMIEFGSGASTPRWALKFPDLSILSFEHEQKFCDETRQYVSEAGVEDQIEIVHAPLKTVRFKGRSFRSYAVLKIKNTCDIVIIDGPPASTRRGREACLYHAYNRLRIGGVVILDDADRADEQTIVKNWLRVYPGSFDYSHAAVGHGLAILHKKRHLPRQKTSLATMCDNYMIRAQKMRSRLGVVKRLWKAH